MRWTWACRIACCFARSGISRPPEKRLGREEAALAAVAELAGSRNPYRVRALEEMAKHCEHRERNYERALEITRNALLIEELRPFAAASGA